MRVLGGASTGELDEETRRLLHWVVLGYIQKKGEGGSWEDEDETEQVEGDDMHTRHPAHEPSTLLIRTQRYLQALHHLFFSL